MHLTGEQANQDDGSCIFEVEGCTDPLAFNYQENATLDDGSCVPVVEGCTLTFAANYDPDANTDDGSCTFAIVTFRIFTPMCIDSLATNYNPYADPESDDYVSEDSVASYGWEIDNSSCTYSLGCTDPSAYNYNPDATVDDDSCIDESIFLLAVWMKTILSMMWMRM